MAGTRFRSVTREALGNIFREVKIALTPMPKPEKWTFIVGCYNSGTTLLSELMGKHPSISALPTEGHFITDQFLKDYDLGIPRMWVDREDIFCLNENDPGPDVERIKKEWAMRLDLSKPVLVEKSPPNAARTRWFQKHFENAHFIGIVRNGYAVAEGISRKGDPKSIKEGWPIGKSAWQWARSNQVMLDDAEQLDKFHLVRYEDLATDPQTELDKIAAFLGLAGFPDLSTQSFAIHERKDSVKDMNQGSIDRLSAEDIKTINDTAGFMLDRLGYPRL
ncbi:sulfotransferase [Alteromonas sp. ASW11-36]|uniref:Sulfotransferase n=1 Tax=Alteromonas arenosi TaxID=3055817 RepID=A0ABT7STV9_9ALTE|nr:sulfotransferase [Alteromonas sp. ASW11-36]MDM7859632.1 sulfotransferase [Alteromonas sp. ASW11-36]